MAAHFLSFFISFLSEFDSLQEHDDDSRCEHEKQKGRAAGRSKGKERAGKMLTEDDEEEKEAETDEDEVGKLCSVLSPCLVEVHV